MAIRHLSAAVRLINSTLDTPESNARPEPAEPATVDTAQDKNRDQQPARKKTARTHPYIPHQDSQLARTAVSLGVLASLVHAGATSLSGNPSQTVKDIGDAEALARIGRDPGYPLNGTYLQTADIDARNLHQSIGNSTHPFTGRYNGQCHTIENLKHCSVKQLGDAGSIHNLLADARINSTEITGVIACEVSGSVRDTGDIYVENAEVFTSGDNALPGIFGLALYHISTPQNWRAMRQVSTLICNCAHPFQTANQPGRPVCLESHQPPSLAIFRHPVA